MMLSPLRYPGAKRFLLPAIERHAASQPVQLFVEPFAGGASTALHLLGTGAVEHAIIADVDPLVAGFWQAAAFRTEELVDAVCAEPVTLERWDHWRAAEPKDPLDVAMTCLFLNRTSFSGILHGHAGPIGGRAQTGRYNIDCRWNAGTLTERIRAVGDLAATGRLLDVWCTDWQTTLKRVADEYQAATAFAYLDPPYVEKATKLYAESFTEDDHRELAEFLTGGDHPFRWLLSYDDHQLVRELYAGQRIEEHEVAYSARGSRNKAKKSVELLVLSDKRGPGRPALTHIERLARRRASKARWACAHRGEHAAAMRQWRDRQKRRRDDD